MSIHSRPIPSILNDASQAQSGAAKVDILQTASALIPSHKPILKIHIHTYSADILKSIYLPNTGLFFLWLLSSFHFFLFCVIELIFLPSLHHFLSTQKIGKLKYILFIYPISLFPHSYLQQFRAFLEHNPKP